MLETPEYHELSTFHGRLSWALHSFGVLERTAQAAHVACAAGVSVRTARRYLAGQTRPRLDRAGAIADSVGAFVGWLVCGGNAPRTKQELEFLQKVRLMSDPDREKLRRMMFRHKNGSQKVQRLFRLFKQGQIGCRALLDHAGA